MPALVLTPTPLDDALLKLSEADSVEVCERLKVMRQQESSTYRVFDYLAKHGELLKRVNKPIDEDCRVKMCEWCYQVRDIGGYEGGCTCACSHTVSLVRLWTFASFAGKPCRLACRIWIATCVPVKVVRLWPIARSTN